MFTAIIKVKASCIPRGVSSNGRAVALHATGRGVDTFTLHFKYSYGKIKKLRNMNSTTSTIYIEPISKLVEMV